MLTQLNDQTVLFVIVQFSINHLFAYSLNVKLAGSTTPNQSGSGCNGNEGVLHITQSSNTGALPSDCLVS